MNARPWVTGFGLLLVLGFVVALCWFSAPGVNAAPAFQLPLSQPVVYINAYPYQPSTLTDISAGSYSPYEQFGSSTQFVAARSSNRATDFAFNYTFTPADAALGKVTFKAEAYINGYSDMLSGHNTVISLPTKLSGGNVKAAGTLEDDEEEYDSLLFLPIVSDQ